MTTLLNYILSWLPNDDELTEFMKNIIFPVL